MQRLALALALGVGALPAGAAVAALTGLGVMRGLGALHVGMAASLVTLLPIAGLWSLFGRSPPALAAALVVWPGLLLAGLPGYFPGEVPGAIGTGFSVFAAPGGRDLSRSAALLGERVAGPVGHAPQGSVPAPEAERAPQDCLPSAVLATGDQAALPYEGSGHSMAIPVQFGDVELPMLFDTGASVTTLNRASLARIGVKVPADAPEISLRTANGERTAKLVLVPRLWVGGLLVEGVTVGICEECADERTMGLLGLNVSSQFLVTVDTVRKEVVFQARESGSDHRVGDRVIDVSPWLRVQARATIYPDTRVEVEVTGESLAPRTIAEAVVGLACGEDRFVARLTNVPPEGSATTLVNLPRGTDCSAYRVTLDGARW
ncbi:MAG: aspartyl protease family protein [Pseudomonadota bacterium]|nr:aspartyl protease family protein [Pseudomonadota bacterium]